METQKSSEIDPEAIQALLDIICRLESKVQMITLWDHPDKVKKENLYQFHELFARYEELRDIAGLHPIPKPNLTPQTK